MVSLWLMLALSLVLCGAFSIGSVNVFVNKCVHDVVFNEDVLFNSSARSVIDCSRQCSRHPGCLTFTFSRPRCQGHSEVMASDSEQTTVLGARTYVQRDAETTVRCRRREGTEVLTVPRRGNVNVFCQDGWIVFLRREDGSEDFYRNWIDYREGFGDVKGEYWLGLEALHQITSTSSYLLKVDLKDWEGESADALYANFSVGPEDSLYPMYLHFLNGTAGDCMSLHESQAFTTKDADHDNRDNKNCAVKHHGAWWYNSCVGCNLCGRFYNSSHAPDKDGITWKMWRGTAYSLNFAQLRMKPDDSC